MITCSVALENNEDVSMEDIFLAADRYDVKELCEETLKPLLANLKRAIAVPFLFRSAYMFAELRKPVVKYITSTIGPAILKDIRTMHKDHPDVFDNLVDLLEA
ncbi:hypothetical protein BGZ74_002486, partial [Mortierella antarctica]